MEKTAAEDVRLDDLIERLKNGSLADADDDGIDDDGIHEKAKKGSERLAKQEKGKEEALNKAIHRFAEVIDQGMDLVTEAAADVAKAVHWYSMQHAGGHEKQPNASRASAATEKLAAVVTSSSKDGERSKHLIDTLRSSLGKGTEGTEVLVPAFEKSLHRAGREAFKKSLDETIANRLVASRQKMIQIAKRWRETGVLDFFTSNLRNYVLVDQETRYATSWRNLLVRFALRPRPVHGCALPIR